MSEDGWSLHDFINKATRQSMDMISTPNPNHNFNSYVFFLHSVLFYKCSSVRPALWVHINDLAPLMTPRCDLFLDLNLSNTYEQSY